MNFEIVFINSKAYGILLRNSILKFDLPIVLNAHMYKLLLHRVFSLFQAAVFDESKTDCCLVILNWKGCSFVYKENKEFLGKNLCSIFLKMFDSFCSSHRKGLKSKPACIRA